MTDAFRKSQFSESVANLQKENVRDSFENPPGLPEGWAAVNSYSNWFSHSSIFPGLSNWIALFHTGGGNQGMNQDLKLVSVFKALVLQAYFSTVLDLFTNNIPLAEEVNCTVTSKGFNVDNSSWIWFWMFIDNMFLVGAPEIGDWASSERRMLTYLIINLD